MFVTRTWARSPHLQRIPLVLLAVAAAAAIAVAGGAQVGGARAEGGGAAACQAADFSKPPPPPGPTTVGTLRQIYRCIFDHYYGGRTLDDRTLLVGAGAGLTGELARLGLDQRDATMPALTGERDRDWDAFAAMYSRVTGEATGDAAVRQQLAEATATGMVASLHDNHAVWSHTGSRLSGYGFRSSIALALADLEPQYALAPLFITAVDPAGPAARAGLAPGDVIEAVDGSAPFVNGRLSLGTIELLNGRQANGRQPLQLTVRRPVTGRTWTVTLSPDPGGPATTPSPSPSASPSPPPPPVDVRLLDGDVAYAAIPSFSTGIVNATLQAIANLRQGHTLRGVIFDIRGNGGGDPDAVATLLGALAHDRVTGYDCDADGHCRADRTNDKTPLLHLPVAVLTDRNAASASDAFSAAVKDLHLGTLVGVRTSGIVAGQAATWTLDDGSAINLPATHALGPNREIINGIGVAPDYVVPLTPDELSAGRDQDIIKALSILR
jgi:carboxyl-terminal processing protease